MHNSTFESGRNVLVLSLSVFLVDMVLSSWFMVLPIYLGELGAGIPEIGFCYALINLAWFGLQFPGGLLSDRIGRKSLVVLSTFTFILCYSVLILASTWVVATLAIVIFWIFSGLQSPSFSSMIAESVMERKRPKAFATYSFLMNLGWAVGPLIGALLIPLYGFQILLYFGVIISIVCFAARLLLLHEPLRKTNESGKFFISQLNKNIAYFIVGCSMFGFASGLISPVTVPYAEKALKLSLVEIELMFSIAQFASSFASILGGIFVGRVGGKRGLATSVLCSCLGIAIWAFSPSFAVAAMLMTFFSIFFYAFYDVAYGTLISSLTTPKNRATIFGVTNVMIGLFTAAGSTTGSYLWEIYTPIVPFLLTAVLAFPSTAILLKVRNDSVFSLTPLPIKATRASPAHDPQPLFHTKPSCVCSDLQRR